MFLWWSKKKDDLGDLEAALGEMGMSKGKKSKKKEDVNFASGSGSNRTRRSWPSSTSPSTW